MPCMVGNCSRPMQIRSRYCHRHNTAKANPSRKTRRWCARVGCRRAPRGQTGYCVRHKETEPMKPKSWPRRVAPLLRERGPLGLLKPTDDTTRLAIQHLTGLASSLFPGIFARSVIEAKYRRKRIRIELDEWLQMSDTAWKQNKAVIDPKRAMLFRSLLQTVTTSVIEAVSKDHSEFSTLQKPTFPVFLIALPEPEKPSPLWTEKNIHRDIDGTDAPRLTIEILLDDISSNNGSVAFWPFSVKYPCHEKHKGRYVEKKEDELTKTYLHDIAGKKGDTVYWDSRMLHLSTANVSSKQTVKLLGYVEP